MRKKEYHKIEVREVFQFLTLTLLSILILFIIGEGVLLFYWNYNAKFIAVENTSAGELVPLTRVKSESIIDQDKMFANYQKEIIKIIDQILLIEKPDPALYQNIRSKVLAMRVPQEYQKFHLHLILLLDQDILKFKNIGENYSRETSKELLKQKQELDNFVIDQKNIIAQNL